MKLHKYILTLACLLLLWGVSTAQQRPQFTQYMVNNYLLNPAVTGAYNYLDLRTGFREQWAGFDTGTPRTFFLSGHAPISPRVRGPLPTIGPGIQRDDNAAIQSLLPKHGVGGMILYDETGPLSRIMAYASYAYNFRITGDGASQIRASLGLQGGFIRYQQNNSELVPDPLNPTATDPALEGDQASSFIPDLGAGLLVYSNRFYAGLSSSQLLGNDLSYSNVNVGNAPNSLVRHYFLTGGYRFQIANGNVDLIPSVLFKYLDGAPLSVDLNGRIAFNLNQFNHFWTGLSYRYNDAAAILAGVSISNFMDINFSYDFPLTHIRTTNSNPSTNIGTFEVSLGLRLSGYKGSYFHNLF